MGKLCERMSSGVEVRRYGETARIEFFSHLGLSCSICPSHFCDMPNRHFRFVAVKRLWTFEKIESILIVLENLSNFPTLPLFHQFPANKPEKCLKNIGLSILISFLLYAILFFSLPVSSLLSSSSSSSVHLLALLSSSSTFYSFLSTLFRSSLFLLFLSISFSFNPILSLSLIRSLLFSSFSPITSSLTFFFNSFLPSSYFSAVARLYASSINVFAVTLSF